MLICDVFKHFDLFYKCYHRHNILQVQYFAQMWLKANKIFFFSFLIMYDNFKLFKALQEIFYFSILDHKELQKISNTLKKNA